MRRILIIEDDETQAALIMRRLRQEGMVCTVSTTFEDGLCRANAEEFDCIVLDLGLPDADLKSAFDTAARIPELRWPVVAHTGSGDLDIIEAVRMTGAAVVVKPGTELLVEKVWSQINYRTADRESEAGQQNAQRRLEKPSFFENVKAIVALAVAILTMATAIGGWLYRTVSNEARATEVIAHRFELIERRLDDADKTSVERGARLKVVENQNQISIDDRGALRASLTGVLDTQRELKADVIRRLERIEDKLDRKQ